MGKFIRRLFMILVLLTIAFLVYRYINPDGASALVEKIKMVSQDIFGEENVELDDNYNITGTTLVISGDIENIEDTGDVSYTGDEDNSWLEDLNQEIEEILGKNDVVDTGLDESDENLDFLGEGTENKEDCIQEGNFSNEELNGGLVCCNSLSGFVKNAGIWLEVDPGDLCYDPSKGEPICDHIGTEQEGWYYSGGDLLVLDAKCHIDSLEGNSDQDNIDEETPVVPSQQNTGLVDADYQQMRDVFGNLVE